MEPIRNDLVALITTLNTLTRESPHFHVPGNIRFVDRDHEAIIATCRLDDDGAMAYLIAANLDIYHPQTLHVPCADLPGHDPHWPLHNVLTHAPFLHTGESLDLTLPPTCVLIVRWS